MKFCGIDFGTTNTAMVYFDDKYGKKQLGDSISGDIMPLPSIVAIHKKTGSIFVGADVKRNIKGLEKDFLIVRFSIISLKVGAKVPTFFVGSKSESFLINTQNIRMNYGFVRNIFERD